MSTQRLLVTLCTYNERDNLEQLIPEIHKYVPDADVLVVDDNSPDGTGQFADEMVAQDSRIHVRHRAGKLGLGTATLEALQFGIDNGYELLINMDADFSHDPRYIPALRECMDRTDVAIGSRYVPGGGVEGWSRLRYLMSGGINVYARTLLRLKTRDNSGSFRCYRVDKLRELDFSRFLARGYAVQEELLYRCRRIGCRFEETPIVFADRRFGSSKINWREAVGALWILLRLGIENLLKVPVAVDASSVGYKSQERSATSDGTDAATTSE